MSDPKYYDPELCARLVSSARRMADDHDRHGSGCGPVTTRTLADQLEAAGREIAAMRCGYDDLHAMVSRRVSLELQIKRGNEYAAEVERLRLSTPSVHGSTIHEVIAERDALRVSLELQIKRGNEYADEVDRLNKIKAQWDQACDNQLRWLREAQDERDSLCTEVERVTRANRELVDAGAAVVSEATRVVHDLMRSGSEVEAIQAKLDDEIQRHSDLIVEAAKLEAERDSLRKLLEAAQARVKELEVIVVLGARFDERAANMYNALHVVWPVFRAAVTWSEAFTGTAAFDALEEATATARSTLTPDLLAELKVAGLEVDQ